MRRYCWWPGVVALSGYYSQPAPLIVQGEVEATEVSVSAKIAGRVESLPFREGQKVSRGDLVATLESRELQAKMDQAEAAAQAAEAQRTKAERGTREEEIRAAYNQWQATLTALELAEKTYARISRLFGDGVVAAQTRDESLAGLKSARQASAAAKATYDMARAGARREDRDAAAAQVAAARGAISEVRVALEEARLEAPLDGELIERVVDVGEMVGAGFPLVKIVDLNDIWVVFNLREDLLGGHPHGFAARSPHSGPEKHDRAAGGRLYRLSGGFRHLAGHPGHR